MAHFVNVMDFASKTGDVTELEQLSEPGCGGCGDYIQYYRDLYSDGGWLRDRDWRSGETGLSFNREVGEEMRATVQVSVSAGYIKPTSDSRETEAPASTHTITLGLRFDDSWRVTQLVAGDVG